MLKDKLFRLAGQTIKNKVMENNQNVQRDKHAETVIRNHVLWSMGASFIIPIPVADIFAVSALQLDMIRQLCRVYDKDFSETQGKAIVTALTSSTLARAGARSLLKLIPGVGTVLGGITVSIFNGASTYALGEVFKQHFSSGGTILDFDTERLKKQYQEKFEKGKKVAEQMRKEQQPEKGAGSPTPEAPTAKAPDSEAVFARLRELGELREQGLLSEAEFDQMKKRLLEGF